MVEIRCELVAVTSRENYCYHLISGFYFSVIFPGIWPYLVNSSLLYYVVVWELVYLQTAALSFRIFLKSIKNACVFSQYLSDEIKMTVELDNSYSTLYHLHIDSWWDYPSCCVEYPLPVFPLHNSNLQVLHNFPSIFTRSHVGEQPFRKPINYS